MHSMKRFSRDLPSPSRGKTQEANRDSCEEIKEISQALINREFLLYYQPKIDMFTGKTIGVEALLRWNHPSLGILSPSAFLPIVENHQLICTIGEWVTEEVLIQAKKWNGRGVKIPISINIAARQFLEPNFATHLAALLAIHPSVDPCDLELELLETDEIKDIRNVAKAMISCQSLGISIAIDDFGTGYSSLLHLKYLPANSLKIDRGFVMNMLQNSGDLAIVKGVIGLAEAFNRTVIAEGVETRYHREALMRLGCRIGQGYGIGMPMPSEEFIYWKREYKP